VSCDRRRRFLIGAGALLTSPLVRGQARRDRARVGVLQTTNRQAASHLLAAFTQRLQELGWVEDMDYELIFREAHADPGRFAPLAAELVALKPDLIFAPWYQTALAVKRLTREIPIVFTAADDPVAAGLVESLARPGSNVTGTSMHSWDLYPKRLQFLKECAPSARTVGVMFEGMPPFGPLETRANEELAEAAAKLDLRVVIAWAASADEIGGAIQRLLAQDAQLFYGWLIFWLQRHTLVQRVNAARLPSVWSQLEYVDAGGLLWYGARLVEQYRHSAGYVDRILRGAKPENLPVEAPSRIELVLNQITARSIGMKVPQSVLLRADRVIE
jgi:putative ABC transport system substrate-binding protein